MNVMWMTAEVVLWPIPVHKHLHIHKYTEMAGGRKEREREHQNKNADVKQLPVGKAGMHTASPRVENTLTKLEMGAEDTFTSWSFKKKEFHLQAHRSV